MESLSKLLLLVTGLAMACSRHDSGSTGGIEEFQQTRDQLCHDFIIETVPRCDRATFHVLMAAVCPGMLLPVQYEYPSGKWNRDIAPCYPTDSASETSRDTSMSLILTKNKEAIQRELDYAEPLKWITGLGPVDTTSIWPLVPMMRQVVGKSLADDADAIPDPLSGFRGHLVANYLWASARVNGGLNAAQVAVLKQLHDGTPSSPYLSALYHRFSDGDQGDTMNLLRSVPHEIGDYGWGSSPWEVHYAASVAVLEGR